MELVEILLFFCTGTMLINILLMTSIWLADKKDLYFYGIGLWVVALVNFGLQGVFEHDPILSILSFSTYYAASLILVRVLHLTTDVEVPYRFYHAVMLFAIPLMFVLSWAGMSFTVVAMPVAIGVALPMLHLSSRYLLGTTVQPMSRIYAVIIFLNGLHFLDYPLLRPVPEFAVYGFSIAFVFILFLSIYFPIYAAKNIAQRYSKMLESEIFEHVKTEQQLKDAVVSAKAAARAKSEFLANMNHEIRTPLNGIMGMNQLILQSDFNEEEIRECATIIDQSSESLLKLVNDLFDVNRLEAGRLKLVKGEFSPRQCVNELISSYENKVTKKGLSMTCAFGDDVPDLVVGDRDRVRQVLDGLVDNAIKFTPDGGINISVFLIERGSSNPELVFEVLDTGIGISQAEQDRMFGVFAQADASLTRERGGAGVGLYIGKRLVELMGGELICRSEKGQGAVFKFSFPFERLD